MRFAPRLFALALLAAQCSATTPANDLRNGFKDGYHLDLREIQRQNQITTQILQNYLEKRLFGQNRSSKPPSVWDILPRARRKPINNIQEAINGTLEPEKETLQSVESETVSSYENYGEEEFDEEGMIMMF